jgi:subtilisin family serine protease
MSLGGGASATIDAAARRVIADGIVLCVAAGNSTANASGFSPARVAEAITVGATTSTDALASYSNFGVGVDILAPGSSITSSWFTSTTAINTISGTSMATPHVTGVAALYKAINPAATPAQVETALKAAATKNKVTGLTGTKATTPNNLLFSNY